MATRHFHKSWSDGTGLRVRVTCRGRKARQYDIQRCWFRRVSEVGVVSSEPQRLSDPPAWCHFSGFLDLAPSPRPLGHRELCIAHHVEDRALQSSMDKIFRTFYFAEDAPLGQEVGDTEGRLVGLLHWQASSGCICHDIHNWMEWGVFGGHDADCLKNAYNIIAACRNSFASLVQGLNTWLPRVLVLEPGDLGLYELWAALSLDTELIELLLTLKFRFSKGRLVASAHLKDADGILNMLCTALMVTWKFIEWCDSGWVGLGGARVAEGSWPRCAWGSSRCWATRWSSQASPTTT